MVLSVVLIALVAIGMILVLVGTLLIFLSALRAQEKAEGKVEGGAVVVVGPLPLVFGTSERVAKVLMVLAIALFAIALAAFLVFLVGLRGVW